ncbi:MAG: glycosyltransferase [Opitutaceae bacterium]|nr:glycosyltransferase [Opitutaceae bacterium]
MKSIDSQHDDVRLAHHWFAARRGGERTMEEIASLFPGAPVSTLVLNRAALGGDLVDRRFTISPLGLIAPRWVEHRKLLPLFPWAIRRLRVPQGTRLLVSSDAALIKGMPRPPGCVHVCYCHTPPRYLWDQADDYARRSAGLGPGGRWLFRRTLAGLRRFDLRAAANVDHFIANSATVADRIRRTYGREAVVIHPPVAVDRFAPTTAVGDYYLVVAELVSYKRVDLAVEACSRLGRRLVVVGDGPELGRLKEAAAPSVEFRGRLGDAEVAALMGSARAFLHPQMEDFGITAVEAQAAGRPVIALRAGGALETVIDGRTGVFFDEASVDGMMDAVRRFEPMAASFDSDVCRTHATTFAAARFRRELSSLLATLGVL